MESLVGRKFTRLEVTSFSHKKGPTYYWNCKCDCGNLRKVTRCALISGTTKSCGCLKGERGKAFLTTHGMNNTRLYHIHENMKQRCLNPNTPKFKDYGGRGVKVCEEWNTFELFKEWAYSNGYKEELELDRVNNDGNYEPSNCRWATRKQQTRNKRNNHILEFMGIKKCLVDWADLFSIPYGTLRSRIKHNWTTTKALICPIKKHIKRGEYGKIA